jgi:hypothetical protein
MRLYRGPLREQGVFFAVQSSADCITNMSGATKIENARCCGPQAFIAVRLACRIGFMVLYDIHGSNMSPCPRRSLARRTLVTSRHFIR